MFTVIGNMLYVCDVGKAKPHQSIRKASQASLIYVPENCRTCSPLLCPCRKGNIAFFPMTIGDYVTVGAKSVVCAAHIGPLGFFRVYSEPMSMDRRKASRLSPQ